MNEHLQSAMTEEDGESFSNLSVCLEIKYLKFELQYWNLYECCRVIANLESLNDLEDKVFMILALYKEIEDLAYKQQHLGGEYHFMDTIQSNEVEDTRRVHWTCIYVYTCVTRVFIQGVLNYLSLIFCTVLLYNFLISCFLNDPKITFKFDEALILS